MRFWTIVEGLALIANVALFGWIAFDIVALTQAVGLMPTPLYLFPVAPLLAIICLVRALRGK